jgi:hypothetical protein
MATKVTAPLIDSSVNQTLHVLDSERQIGEKFSSMSEDILAEIWSQFNAHYHELLDFRPSQKSLDDFGRAEVKSTVARNCSKSELETLYQELSLIKVGEQAMSEGFTEGLGILFSLQKKVLSSKSSKRLFSVKGWQIPKIQLAI